MGLKDLENAVTNVMKDRETNDVIVKSAKVSGNYVQVDGKQYPYLPAVDVPVATNDRVFVAVVDGNAVVIGR